MANNVMSYEQIRQDSRHRDLQLCPRSLRSYYRASGWWKSDRLWGLNSTSNDSLLRQETSREANLDSFVPISLSSAISSIVLIFLLYKALRRLDLG
jgi:hypothetical protein